MQSTTSISSLIWSVVDDDLRELFKLYEYGRVMERENDYDNDGLDQSEEYFRKKKKR